MTDDVASRQILFGFLMQTLAYGLMIRFRQSSNGIGEIIIVRS